MSNFKIYFKSILIPLLIGVIVGFLTSGDVAYNSLIQPWFAPPAILFPIVWTILYSLMGVSYGILKTNSLVDSDINLIYYFQLFVNALWSFIFFSFELRLLAFFWILFLVVLISMMIYKFYSKNKISGLLQIPYLLWIIFASFLNLSVYLLNR